MGKPKLEVMASQKGEVDSIGNLRFLVHELNHQLDVERGRIYHALPGSMTDRLKPYKIKGLGEVMLLMQELGLLRLRGAHKTTVWFVIDIKYFDDLVSDEWLDRACLNLLKHTERINKLRRLERQLLKLLRDNSVSESSQPNETHIEAMAEMVARIEDLQSELAAKELRLAALESELAEKSGNDADAVATALIEKFRKMK